MTVPSHLVVVPQIVTTVAESLEFQKIWLWQQFSARVTPGVQRIVEFAKRVPGFCDFTQDDQLILIKLGFFEVWLTHVARLINDTTLTLDDGAYLTRQQLEILYDVSKQEISPGSYLIHSSYSPSCSLIS